MGIRTICASFAAFDGADTPESVPTEFKLLSAGANTHVGGEILFDSKSADSVMQVFSARKLDLMADYEHQSLAIPPIQAPASAKKWTPEVRGGELFATNIQWTKKAREYIANGEYRYFSIAARVDSKTNRVVEVVNFALTNTPAANGIQPLVAASVTAQSEPKMKTVIVALGLRADAEEADALAAVSQLKDFERQVIALSGKSSLSEALGAMRAMAQSHEQVVALGAKVKELETDKRCQAFDALVKKGQDDVKLSPAVANGEWIKSLRAREDGVTQLTAFLADAPKVVGTVGEKPKEATGSTEVVAFSKEEIAIAKVVTGGDPVALKANLEKLSAYKRERAEILNTGLGR